MNELMGESVELIVTSPPYPMFEKWDVLFEQWAKARKLVVGGSASEKHFTQLYLLELVWKECIRVLVDGGIMCVNIGDACRKDENDNFRLPIDNMNFIDFMYIF